MKSVNRVTLIGYVGKDPERRFTKTGLEMASFPLATDKKLKDSSKVTSWHNIIAFGKVSEIVINFVKKGSKLYIDGEIQYQNYEKDGVKCQATKILINDFSVLDEFKQSPRNNEKSYSNGNAYTDDTGIPF